MSDCVSEPGDLYPHTSAVIKLAKCLPAECGQVGSQVVIKTKINTVVGIIDWVDSSGKIRVKYDAEKAGYVPCYALEQCDVVSIRCFTCCDDRFFELPSCELTEEAIDAALGSSVTSLTGNIFLYVGSINEPDCLWKWNGFNDLKSPDNWIDQYGRLPEQFEQLADNGQLEQFLTWFISILSGAGIAFNVNEAGSQIIVTVGDGEAVAPSSFVISYSNGRIQMDPNDGSGAKFANVIESGDGPPTEPYNWFFYVNTNTNGVMLNVGGVAKLIGFADDPNPNTCTDLINCIVANLEAGALEPDQYAIPELVGPHWQIGGVIYGTGTPTLAEFGGCPGGDADSLDELVLALNDCPNNPLYWNWVNNGGVLTLCVPVGTHILTVEYGDPSAIKNFAGVPTTPGEEGTDLCLEIAECLSNRGLVGASGSALTTESAIESYYDTASGLTVRWTDADGDERVSFKDPVNGWYHQVTKEVTAIEVYELQAIGGASGSHDGDLDIRSLASLPDDVRWVHLCVTSAADTGASAGILIYTDKNPFGDASYYRGTMIGQTGGDTKYTNLWVPLKSDGTIYIQVGLSGTGTKSARIFVIGWKR